MKKVLINYAEPGRENYLAGQERLIDSFIDGGWNGDYLIFSTHQRNYRGVEIKNAGFTSHKINPYGFKVEAFEHARQAGYDEVIWCDSSIVLLGGIEHFFENANKTGVTAFHNLGHDLHRYISDKAAEYFGILTNPLFSSIPQIMANVIIFNFSNFAGRRVFEDWRRGDSAGLFHAGGSVRSEFVAHRHDQAILSAVLWLAGIELQPYGGVAYEPFDKTRQYGDVYLLCKGIPL